MALPVPDKIKNQVLEFIQLPEQSRKRFDEALGKAPLAIHPLALAGHIEKYLRSKNIKIVNVYELIRTLINLVSVREVLDIPFSELTDDVFNSISPKIKTLKLDPTEIDKAKKDLVKLLKNNRSLKIPSKANEVLQEHEHVYRSARILTDIRPIFEESNGPKPLAAVLIHTLKITYSFGDSLRHFFVALDSRDLKNLGKLVSRAEDKENALIPLLRKTSLKHIKIP